MIMDREEEGTLTPVMTDDDVTFIHIKCNNIYVVAVTQGKSYITTSDEFLTTIKEMPM